MPSHSERVRRNYLTTKVDVVDNKREHTIEVRAHITRHAIASWSDRRHIADEFCRHLVANFHGRLKEMGL